MLERKDGLVECCDCSHVYDMNENYVKVNRIQSDVTCPKCGSTEFYEVVIYE